MKAICSTAEAQIYVGTYKKYNEGSLFGKWMRLADYSDKAEFYKACRELHKDEDDPEFMFQDYEYIPEGMVGESWVSEKVWDLMDIDDEDAEIATHYCSAVGIDPNDYEDIQDLVDEAKEKFVGQFDSLADLGQYFEECLGEIPSHLYNYIDWEAYGRDINYDLYSDDDFYFDTNR